MLHKSRQSTNRHGGVYIAVLGTSLIVTLLAFSAIALQRLQNRMLSASSDVHQAQLNAEAALEIGLLAMKQDENWRSNYDELQWFDPPLETGAGACQLEVNDADADIDDVYDGLSAVEAAPVRLTGIGHSPASGQPGLQAVQRVELVVNPRRDPHGTLQPNSVMQPNWTSVVAYYQSQGTPLVYSSLPNAAQMPNQGRNVDIESTPIGGEPPFWTGDLSTVPIAGTGTAQVQRSNNEHRSGSYSLRVRNRTSTSAGASQDLSFFLKPETSYHVEVWGRSEGLTALLAVLVEWRFTLRIKTVGNAAATPVVVTATKGTASGGWTPLTATLPTPNWSGELEYAYLTISCDIVAPLLAPDFYADDFLIRDNSSGRFIYKKALGPGHNLLYSGAPTNAEGIYWIDCGGQNLIIERSRIRGTLLVLNPGTSSRVDYGPIWMSPHRPGYPTLLVNGDLTIRATSRYLSEMENLVNYNPTGAIHKLLGEDADLADTYSDSGIRGLVAVAGNLTYKNNPTIRGRVIVGGTTTNSGSPTLEYQPDSLLSPPPEFYDRDYVQRNGSGRKAVLP